MDRSCGPHRHRVRSESCRRGRCTRERTRHIDTFRSSAPRQTLLDVADPTGGGFRIEFSTPNGRALCTLGFNTVWNGQPALVTNSHCSEQMFAVNGTVLFQPSFASGRPIAREVADPGTRFCFPFRRCRYSDAAVFAYEPGVPVGQGLLANTVEYVEDRFGALTVNTSAPWLYLFEKNAGNIPVGSGIYKVGQTSGGTFGRVTRACVDYLGNAPLRCQHVADLTSWYGDSGSPIFTYSINNAGWVLLGLLWGGPDNDQHTTWFSPLSGIERDLGVLKVCTASAPC